MRSTAASVVELISLMGTRQAYLILALRPSSLSVAWGLATQVPDAEFSVTVAVYSCLVNSGL